MENILYKFPLDVGTKVTAAFDVGITNYRCIKLVMLLFGRVKHFLFSNSILLEIKY